MPFLKRRISPEVVIAVAALLTSVCALFVTVYQTNLTRKQQYASAWPYLEFTVTNGYEDATNATYLQGLSLANTGLGPAIIKEIRIQYKAKSYATLREALLAHYRDYGLSFDDAEYSKTELSADRVINPGARLPIIEVFERGENTKIRKYADALQKALLPGPGQLMLTIKFASIYDEVWYARLGASGPPVVKANE